MNRTEARRILSNRRAGGAPGPWRSGGLVALWFVWVGAALGMGCGDDGSPGHDAAGAGDAAWDAGGLDGQADGARDADSTVPDGAEADVRDGGGGSCHGDPGPADKPRFLVVSHPFDAQGGESHRYELVSLDQGGNLVFTGTEFEMGRASDGVVAFTPDGQVGVVAQEDGSLGVFVLSQDGTVRVVEAALTGDFYASRVVAGSRGERFYVLDAEWRENGGGIYSFTVACDGHLTAEGLVAEARLPYGMVWSGPDKALVYARDLLDSPQGRDVHEVSWQAGQPSRLRSGTAFSDDAIVASVALTADGAFVLVGDNCGFCSSPNRVAAVSTRDLGLVQTMELEDPMSIVCSPFGGSCLVASGFGDALFVLAYEPGNPSEPFTLQGELTYRDGRPALPAGAVLLDRGPLRGMVFVAENLGIRRVRFTSDGGVEDLGLTSSGSGTDRVVGAIGVQP